MKTHIVPKKMKILSSVLSTATIMILFEYYQLQQTAYKFIGANHIKNRLPLFNTTK